jgi:hypothetical protein
MFLNGVDPVGESWMATRSVLVREAWAAITVAAEELQREARQRAG